MDTITHNCLLIMLQYFVIDYFYFFQELLIIKVDISLIPVVFCLDGRDVALN